MRREAEPRRPPARYLETIDAASSKIRPDDPDLADWFAKYRRQHRTRLAADLWLVERHVVAGAQILECGAVPLLATAALVELDYRVAAVDVAPERFRESISDLGLDVRACDIEAEPMPFDDEIFDAVLFNELFEHLRINPIVTLREVRRVLKPGGVLLLSTPNLRSFRGVRNLVLHDQGHASSAGIYQQYEKLESLGHMGHVREYTVRDVSDFLTRLGFRVETVIFRGGHGRGIVGLAERLAPSWRPFFSLIAVKDGAVKDIAVKDTVA